MQVEQQQQQKQYVPSLGKTVRKGVCQDLNDLKKRYNSLKQLYDESYHKQINQFKMNEESPLNEENKYFNGSWPQINEQQKQPIPTNQQKLTKEKRSSFISLGKTVRKGVCQDLNELKNRFQHIKYQNDEDNNKQIDEFNLNQNVLQQVDSISNDNSDIKVNASQLEDNCSQIEINSSQIEVNQSQKEAYGQQKNYNGQQNEPGNFQIEANDSQICTNDSQIEANISQIEETNGSEIKVNNKKIEVNNSQRGIKGYQIEANGEQYQQKLTNQQNKLTREKRYSFLSFENTVRKGVCSQLKGSQNRYNILQQKQEENNYNHINEFKLGQNGQSQLNNISNNGSQMEVNDSMIEESKEQIYPNPTHQQNRFNNEKNKSFISLGKTVRKGVCRDLKELQLKFQSQNQKQQQDEILSLKPEGLKLNCRGEFSVSKQNSQQSIPALRSNNGSENKIGNFSLMEKYQSFTSISYNGFFKPSSQESIQQLQSLSQDWIEGSEGDDVEQIISKDYQRIIREFRSINLPREEEFKECLTMLYEKGFRILSYLSNGGQGFVYKGFNINTNLKVAIKLSYFGKDQKQNLLNTITKQKEQEDKILKEIKCFNNIVITYEFFLCKQTVIQVMEYCERDLQSDIQERKQQNNPYTLQEVANLMFQLINSLIEIHINSIVHLDIKPGNILIAEDGGIKLTDFGISHFYHDKSIVVETGTLNYCSPEQIQHLFGDESEHLPQIDEKSDIFSMGLTFLSFLGINLNREDAKRIREGDWSSIDHQGTNRTLFSFIKYFMLNKEPQLRQRSFILKLTLIDYLRQFIDLNNEISRIDSLISQFQNQEHSKYLAYLYCQKGLLTDDYESLEKSIQIAQITKGFVYVDQLYINYIYGRSLVQNQYYSKGQDILLNNLTEQQFLNEDSPDIVETLNSLALSFERLGDDQVAFDCKMKGYTLRQKQFQGDHPYIADSLSYLAISYQRLGDDQKAHETEINVLEMRERLFQGDHPDIAQSLSNLAISYSRLGDDKKALHFEQRALKMKENLYLGYHPEIAESLCSLAVSSSRLGDDLAALEYQIQALQMYENIYQGDHPSTAESQNILGIQYSRIGDNEKAIEYKQLALEMRKRLFINDHPDIAQSLSSLAVQFSLIGQNEQALEYQMKALQMRQKLFQGDHPDIAQSLSSLAVSYSRLGDDKQGLECELKALKMRERLYKGDHPEIADSLSNLADSYSCVGNEEMFVEYEIKALKMREKLFKEDHPEIAFSLNRLAISFQKAGKFQEALLFNLRALEMRQNLFQGDYSDIQETFYNLAVTYEGLGNINQSQEYVEKCIELYQKNESLKYN